jgi:serine/threonine protein kinase
VNLLDPLGAGGSATVWRAWDSRSRRYVAAKLIGAATPERIRLRHPHVLTPSEWLECDGVTVALLPLVRGGTADRLLAECGGLPATYVAVLLDQLLDALGALHDAGYVHRDVKPANLLLEPTGTGRPHLWLGDLDVATSIGETGTLAGTAGYLAPEVRPGSAALPSHDLYAAGVTAVELLTGGRVGRARGPFGRLLGDLVAANPDDRPSTAAAARARLHAIGVPTGTPWRRGPRVPDVPDRTRRLSPVARWRVQGRSAAQ